MISGFAHVTKQPHRGLARGYACVKWSRLYTGLGLGTLLLFASVNHAAAQASKSAGSDELTAVLDFEPIGASKVQASAITDRMREELINTGKYTLVDRSQLNAVLDEQALQQTGCTSQECAVKVGKILGVRKLVTGRVTKLDEKMWLLSAQIIEVETAKTLRAVSHQQQVDFATLLDTGIAQLAAKLTATAGSAGPAASACGPPPANPNIWQEPVTCMEFVRIPAGEYIEGCFPGATGCDDDELPGRRVTLSEVWFGKTEVTQAQWTRVIGNNPSAFPKAPDYPVENVSWEDAQQFIRLLNSRSGAVLFRLPTEAEWEYACRAGGKPITHGTKTGEFDVKLAKVNSSDSTAPVASYPPNALGLYDMSGNVSEWVQDTYDEAAYASGPATNPVSEGTGPRRVLRGGSWYSNRKIARCTDRNKDTPTFRGTRVGFRLAKGP